MILSIKMLRKFIAVTFTTLILSLPLSASARIIQQADHAFLVLANDYFNQSYYPEHPTDATQLGIHRYDKALEGFSRDRIKHDILVLKQFEKKVHAVNSSELSQQVRGDWALVLGHIRSRLLTAEVVKPWEKNPDYYSSGVTTAAFVIVERKFAPSDERLKVLIAREKLMPAALAEARHNLKNPPKIFTEIAIEQLPGLIEFFKQDIPAAFSDVKNSELKKQFSQTNAAVVTALKSYLNWLHKDVLSISHGDFRIGADTFQKKLQYEEMVNLPLEKLLAINLADMRKNQKEILRLSKEIDPGKTPQQILTKYASSPSPKKLLPSFSDTFNDLIHFIHDRAIISIPSDVRPIMEETPPFLRAVTFASMDTPGPYESVAKEAYFNVTLPNARWDKAKIKEYMEKFSYPMITGTSVHEAYPGHYVQFLWIQTIKDPVRKILGARTNAEGWAHYCEQMMLDEGYSGKSDLETKLLRISQLLDALWRNARFTVGIKLHTGQMSFKQAIDFFEKEGFQPRIVGLIETKRATSDPTYLYYTLGKLEILKLRADVKAKQGDAFRLQTFHDDFMRQGFPPIKIVREAMLGDNSPTL